MQRIVRAVPVKSKDALRELADKVEKQPSDIKERFLQSFGNPVEDWYYQEIEGKPYIIAVIEGATLTEGFAQYPTLDDPFFNWFRDEVLELSGVDLRIVPTAAPSEHIFQFKSNTKQ